MRALLTACAIGAATMALSACASDSYGGNGDRYANACERDQANQRAAGTVVGAGVGALAGSAIAGNSSNTEGAVLGGVAGAVVGNQVAKSRERCRTGYYGDSRGYYDDRGRPYR